MESKKCTICKAIKAKTDFNRKKAARDGLQPHCRKCSHARFKAYYHANRPKHYREVKENSKRYQARNREIILEAKSLGCSLCPESEPCCLDFHHVRDKWREVSKLLDASEETLRREIAKCVVVCANCHRKIHAGLLHVPVAA